MPLPSFTIDPTTHVYDILGTAVGTAIDTGALQNSRVVFQSNLPLNSFIAFNGDMYRAIRKVFADVAADGTIKADSNPVVLLANDSGLSVANIQWTVSILMPTPGGAQPSPVGTFVAPGAGDVLSLSSFTAVVPSDVTNGSVSTGYYDGGTL